MKFDQPGVIESYAEVLKQLGGKCSSTEAIAVDTINYLYNCFGEPGELHHCALMRFFRTITYAELTPHLQNRVRRSIGIEPTPTINCLTLLATRGIEADWNDRLASKGHQVIPLLSEQVIDAAPMIAQLIKKLGIDVTKVLEPTPGLFLNPQGKEYSTMYVPEASGNSAIVAQGDFVKPFGIRSVIGLGSLLPTGDMFAVIMFMRVFVSKEIAEKMSYLTAAIESSINEIRSGKKNSARILIAAGADEKGRFLRLLGGRHEIVTADSLNEAKSLIDKETFDLILCGTNFDDSRMFELLNTTKHNKLERMKPFICFSQLAASKSESTISLAASTSGAACYLESDKLSDAELLEIVQSYLPEEIWNGSVLEPVGGR